MLSYGSAVFIIRTFCFLVVNYVIARLAKTMNSEDKSLKNQIALTFFSVITIMSVIIAITVSLDLIVTSVYRVYFM